MLRHPGPLMRLCLPVSGMSCIGVAIRSFSAVTYDMIPIGLTIRLQSCKGFRGGLERVLIEGSK